MFKRRNGCLFKLLRLWLPFLLITVLVFLVFLYIHNNNPKGSLHSQSFQQVFAKNIYQNIHPDSSEVTNLKPRNYCEVIHIGIVSAGFTSNLHFNALLKSLFLHRLNPLHFHLLVDDDSERVLDVLFKTWQLPQVKVSFYNIKKWLKDVRWVPNGHYSGNYGLLKLIYSKIIPTNVTKKLLVLDTDLVINGDIYLLWKYFEEFNIKQAVGLVENQSQYYLGKLRKSNPWPAIGVGFNTGVMLYDLEKLNSMKWNTIWVNLTKRQNLIYGQTNLGDQDIMNSVIVQHPNILFRLPCYWNTQMSDNSLSEECYKIHKPMILHWNSPKKFDVTTKDGEKFRGLANTAFELNGNWFRKSPQMCDEETIIPMTINNDADDCQTFIKPPGVFYRTLLFFREYKYVSEEYDITYVTHLSYDRFGLIEDIVKIWTGPMSITLYVTDVELMKVYRVISESDILNPRTDISYHAVFKEGDFYPINTLRNTGLKNVNTPYVFLADIDFTPMNSLYEILKDNIKSMGDLNKKALIVPAFELKKSSVKIPKSKIQLLKALDKKQVVPFLANTWTAAHIPTDYEKWKREFEPYQVQWKANYEPYILVKRDVARYDERFLGFGWNKVSHIMELKAQDYEFIVLSDVFIIHQSHQPSYDNMKYRKSAIYRQCLQSLKTKFIEELHKKYNKTRTDLDDIDDISEYFVKRKKERKRDVGQGQDTTTTLYDSTDFFLVWGGKEKAERKKENRKKFLKESFYSPISDENLKVEYNYYDEHYPYNSTSVKSKFGENNLKENNKYSNFTSSEEHDYEYSEDDEKFKLLHDSTTNVDFVENSTALIEHEKNWVSNVAVDEKLKAI